MVRNNIKLILYQGVISLIYGIVCLGYLITMPLSMLLPFYFRWMIPFGFSMVILWSYFTIGLKLEKQTNRMKNFLSVAGVVIVSLIWYLISDTMKLRSAIGEFWIWPFEMASSYCYQYKGEFNAVLYGIVLTFLSFVPALITWAGMEHATDKTVSRRIMVPPTIVVVVMWVYTVYNITKVLNIVRDIPNLFFR